MLHTKWKFLLIAVSIFLWILLSIYFINAPQFVSSDGAQYLIGAQTIRTHGKYQTFNTLPQLVGTERIPQYNWPPFYSFCLAAVMLISGQDVFSAGKILHFLCSLVFFLSWLSLVWSRFKNSPLILSTFLLTMVFPLGFWFYYRGYYSEGLFVTLCAILLNLCMYHTTTSRYKHKLMFVAAISVTLGLMTITRYAGLGFVLGLGVYMVWRIITAKEKILSLHTVLFISPVSLIYGSWVIRNKLLLNNLSFQNKTDLGFGFIEAFIDCTNKVMISVVGIPQRFEQYGVILLLGLCILLVINWKPIKHFIAADSFNLLLILLSSCYFLMLLIVRKKYGFSPMRYYYLLQPMAVFLLLYGIRFFRHTDSSQPPVKRYIHNCIIYLIFGLMFLSGTRRTFSEIQTASILSNQSHYRGSYLPMFMHSGWLLNWLKSQPKDNSLYCSNFTKYAPLLLGGPCIQLFSKQEENQRFLQLISAKYEHIYLILSKEKGQWKSRPDWDFYLNTLSYDILNEDNSTIVVKLKK
ncbi:MAG: hypothetical protein HQK83_13790 [Fibrobacteria bacterium]|nr:hypothetical protein [Fibrobacteria bacterium]